MWSFNLIPNNLIDNNNSTYNSNVIISISNIIWNKIQTDNWKSTI